MKNYEKPKSFCTGKSLSEAHILSSTNPKYDDRLFIELQAQYMKFPRTIFLHNMFSTCSAKRRPSDKDLPVFICKAKKYK